MLPYMNLNKYVVNVMQIHNIYVLKFDYGFENLTIKVVNVFA